MILPDKDDVEMNQELDKAFAIASTHHVNLIRYKLALLNLCVTSEHGRCQIIKYSDLQYGWPHGFSVIDALMNYIHKDLLISSNSNAILQ